MSLSMSATLSLPRARRRAVVERPAVIELIGAPVVGPGPGEALVTMTVSGVCGSDLHAAAGLHPMIPLPYFPGHEVVGVVERVGAGVDDIAIGMRVTPEPTLPCGTCKLCLTGRENICENLQFFGCGYAEGGMTDSFTVPAGRLHVIPDDLTDLQAVLIEPLATPVHAVRLAGGLDGKTVAILGCGTIGLLMLATARFRGARRVVMTDVLDSKRDRALRLGADAAIDPSDADAADQILSQLGETADAVFDCVSIQSTVDLGIRLVGKGGTVVIVGVPERDVTIPLPVLQDRQIRIQGAATYVAADFSDAIEIIRSGAVSPETMITATFSLAEVADAFAAAARGDQVKVVLTP